MNHPELFDVIIVCGIVVCAQAIARHDVPRGTFGKWHTVENRQSHNQSAYRLPDSDNYTDVFRTELDKVLV